MIGMTNLTLDEKFPDQQIVSAPSLAIGLQQPPKRFYRHGWQSWSLAAWTDLRPPPVQKPAILHPMQVDPAYAKEQRPHGSWVGAVELEGGKILLLGALGLDAHIIATRNQLEGNYESGGGDWFIAYGEETTAFAGYARELGRRLGAKPDKPAPRVWCSWYSLYTAIDENTLLKVLDELGRLPFDVFQVDDGWQVSVGDWEANSKFPSGMKGLAGKIKTTGRRAGLWLAPLIAAKSSRLFREHPDWFLRDEHSRLVSAGFNWGQQLYALDPTHPSVLQWLAALMKQVRAWGFDYLKLDFLYAGALPGRHHQEMPREAAYRKGLKAIREAMGEDAYFLSCGAPIIPSLGLCDAMRIGPDVAGEWENRRDVVFLNNPAVPSTKNAIRTSLHRLWLSPLVQVDPDAVYFRSRECSLTAEQRSLLQSLALICNFKATSDLPAWLTSGEREDLRAFLEAKPGVKQMAQYVFQIDGRPVDFSAALPLPEAPSGAEAIQAALVGWLGNHGWALKINDKMGRDALEKMKKGL
ncbi:MAG TPA: glycoside hydrolase family 36 protein [Anaerolineales bacterium]|nr:glycoside hydrolase family 36 protein [Anaerolineales bacterium]